MSWRTIKRAARQTLHQHMKVAALYIPPGGAPQPVFVRVHTKDDVLLGDMVGTNFSYAEKQEIEPSILFMRDEVAMPVRNAIVMISATEGYRINNVKPADDISITAEVTRLMVAELAGQPIPAPEV